MADLKVAVTAEDHIQGNEHAQITLLEYGDFQCPDAGAAYPMVKRLQKHYGKKLRLVFRNFPLTSIHPMAEIASEAAEFAASKGMFWEMHDALFENQESLSTSMLAELLEDMGLDVGEAEEALQNRQFRPRIQKDIEGGKRSGVHGTPTFFINGEQYDGKWEYEELVAAIDEVI